MQGSHTAVQCGRSLRAVVAACWRSIVDERSHRRAAPRADSRQHVEPAGQRAPRGRVLAPRFRALGFDVKIIQTPDSAKTVFIARIKGDGSKRPVLLAAHADVVGVEREKWSVDPFAGIDKDGHVYGRGAIDFKGGMAVFARAVMMLAERKVPLARDVIFLAEADEEGGEGTARRGWRANTGTTSTPSSR